MVHAVATAAVASISSTTFAAPATAVSYAKQPTHAITTGAGAAAATLALALAVSSAACPATLAATSNTDRIGMGIYLAAPFAFGICFRGVSHTARRVLAPRSTLPCQPPKH